MCVLGGLAAAAGAEDEASLRARAERVHREAIVVDGHNDVPLWCLDYGFDLGMDGSGPEGRSIETEFVFGSVLPAPEAGDLHTHTDLARLRAGGVDAQWFSVFVANDEGRPRALAMIAAVEEQARRHADLELARSVADVRRIARAGRVAALMGLEGGHAIESSLANLRDYHARGIRYMTLTWTRSHDWADSSGDEGRHDGLSDFGREVVREMNRLGIIVDVSHASDATFFDVIDTSRAPVMASHSSMRAIADLPRNLSDDMLRALASNGGVVMVNFGGFFLDPSFVPRWRAAWRWVSSWGSARPPLSIVADHIDHAVRVAGVDHVGLGSDFDGTLFMPQGLEDVTGYPNLTLELLRRGYAEGDLKKILGGNALRVLAAVEAVAGAD